MAQRNTSTGSKVALSLGLIIVSALYAVWQSMSGRQSATSPAQEFKTANQALLQTLTQVNQQTSTTPSPAQPSSQAPAPAPISPKPAGQYVDGSYTGNPADAYYGTVQVKAVISGGRIADVQFLQYPSDRSTSRYINSQAMPLLTQEAISVQSAQVDGVSGATATSGAFIESLASALAKAK